MTKEDGEREDRTRQRGSERETQTLNQLSVHQWVRSAILASQQPTSPIGFLSLKPPCAVLLVWVILDELRNAFQRPLWPFNSHDF
jgi:hypothetical protein